MIEMEEKLQIYLDTNVIFGWFKAKIDEERKGKRFILPERLEKLLELNYELFVSPLVKAEVSRNLKSDSNLEKEKINELWNIFLEEMKVEQIILENFQINWEELVNVVQSVPLKLRGAVEDLVHIQIARKLKLKFLTSEDMERLKEFYDNIMIIDELYGLLSLVAGFPK